MARGLRLGALAAALTIAYAPLRQGELNMLKAFYNATNGAEWFNNDKYVRIALPAVWHHATYLC